jgi:hypothetical protein
MKKKSLKRTLIVSGCYVILLAVLLVGLTLARYQDAMLAYTGFKAADFNALILGANTVAAMKAGTVNKFGVNLVTTGFKPGMTWDSSDINNYNPDALINFSVSNGNNDEDSSQVSVEYTLRLRTSGNLPLTYTLAEWIEDAGPEGGHYVYYSSDEGTPVTDDPAALDPGNWYEYIFHPSGEPAEEAVFELQGGQLSLNSYRILIKWPVPEGSEANSPVYMKEVELVEILANLSSKNMLEEDGYGAAPISTAQPEYSTGIILLDPEGKLSNSYSYEIDYRSFKADTVAETARSHSFTIENGIDKQVTQATDHINYTALLKIPYNTADDYTYTLNNSDEPLELMEYRLYDERLGSYETLISADYPEGKREPDYRIYAVYRLSEDGELDNSANDADTYTLTIKKADSGVISKEELEAISFGNKLEVLVEAEFTD